MDRFVWEDGGSGIAEREPQGERYHWIPQLREAHRDILKMSPKPPDPWRFGWGYFRTWVLNDGIKRYKWNTS